MPIVDDPYDFGRIAATNAISRRLRDGRQADHGAGAGRHADQRAVDGDHRPILEGGESVCREAGIPIAGGHTIDSVEPIYGLVALGLVHPEQVKRNADAQRGDCLILGKPLGVGVLSAALKKEQLDAAGYAQMIATTTQLNTPGPELAALHGRARADRRHRLRPGRPRAGNGARREAAGADRLGERAAAGRRARTRGAGHGHRRLGPQLGRLRRTRSRCPPALPTATRPC